MEQNPRPRNNRTPRFGERGFHVLVLLMQFCARRQYILHLKVEFPINTDEERKKTRDILGKQALPELLWQDIKQP